MEALITKKQLMKALSRAQGASDKRSTLPILSGILLSAEKDALRFSATDLFLGVDTVVPAQVVKTGTVALPAKTFFEIVKSLPDGEVSLIVGPNRSLELKSGKAKFRISGMPGDDFPPLANPEHVDFHAVDVDLLSDLIAKTSFSMSSDDQRPHLSGTLFECDGTVIKAVTTDGHRLSKAERRAAKEMGVFKFLLPSKGVAELKRLLEDIKGDNKSLKTEKKPSEQKTTAEQTFIDLGTMGGNVFFKKEGVLLICKLTEENFPPYNKVIPQKQDKQVVCSRQHLLESIRRISLVSNETSGGIRIYLEQGMIRIVSENARIGEGSEELDVDYNGPTLTMGLNAKYLTDILSALTSDDVVLNCSGELDPMVVKPSNDVTDFVGVVMPMRI